MKKVLVIVLFLFVMSLLPEQHAVADYASPYVYIDCQPNHSLHVRSIWVSEYDNPPAFTGHAFNLDKITKTQRSHECQISASIKVMINFNISREQPRNNNLSILLNKKGVVRYYLDNTRKNYDLLIKNAPKKINVISTVIEQKKKTTNTYFYKSAIKR